MNIKTIKIRIPKTFKMSVLCAALIFAITGSIPIGSAISVSVPPCREKSLNTDSSTLSPWIQLSPEKILEVGLKNLLILIYGAEKIDNARIEDINRYFSLPEDDIGTQIAYDFRRPAMLHGKRIGKRKEGDTWVIPCVFKKDGVSVEYEAVLALDGSIVNIRRATTPINDNVSFRLDPDSRRWRNILKDGGLKIPDIWHTVRNVRAGKYFAEREGLSSEDRKILTTVFWFLGAETDAPLKEYIPEDEFEKEASRLRVLIRRLESAEAAEGILRSQGESEDLILKVKSVIISQMGPYDGMVSLGTKRGDFMDLPRVLAEIVKIRQALEKSGLEPERKTKIENWFEFIEAFRSIRHEVVKDEGSLRLAHIVRDIDLLNFTIHGVEEHFYDHFKNASDGKDMENPVLSIRQDFSKVKKTLTSDTAKDLMDRCTARADEFFEYMRSKGKFSEISRISAMADKAAKFKELYDEFLADNPMEYDAVLQYISFVDRKAISDAWGRGDWREVAELIEKLPMPALRDSSHKWIMRLLSLLYSARIRQISDRQFASKDINDFDPKSSGRFAIPEASIALDDWGGSRLIGTGELGAREAAELLEATLLLRKKVRGHISRDEYYKTVQRVLDPQAKIIRDIGKENGVKAIELVRNELGEEFIPLLTEPGTSTRVSEFVKFAKTVLARPGKKPTPWEMRNMFADFLGEITVYRSLSVSEEDMETIKRQGFLSRFTELIANTDVPEDELAELERTSKNPEALIEMLAGLSPESNIFTMYAHAAEYFRRGVRRDVIMRSRVTPFLAYSQSLTGIKQIAKDLAMARPWGKSKREGSERKPYLFTIKAPRIHLIEWNEDSFPMYARGDDTGNTYGKVAIILTDGARIEMSDPRCEVFCQDLIPPEWIQSVEEIEETDQTYRWIYPDEGSSLDHNEKGSSKTPKDIAVEDTSKTGINKYFMHNMKSADGVLSGFADRLFSILATKKVVLAFDGGIGGANSELIMGTFNEIRRLRRDPKYSLFLQNLVVVNASSERLYEEIRGHIEKNTEIFVFARDSEREILGGIESMTHVTYVDEKEYTWDTYYPLVEMVTIALSQHVEPSTLDNIKDLLKDLNLSVSLTAGGYMFFTLLPNAERYDRRELLKKYAALKRALIAA